MLCVGQIHKYHFDHLLMYSRMKFELNAVCKVFSLMIVEKQRS